MGWEDVLAVYAIVGGVWLGVSVMYVLFCVAGVADAVRPSERRTLARNALRFWHLALLAPLWPAMALVLMYRGYKMLREEAK